MFSKTRILYYDNKPSSAVIGNYTNFLVEIPEISKSYPYLSVGVPANIHNWSYIPLNSYGLYCTFGEIQSLVENNDSFTPVKLEVTLGHTIPLARYPSTANSTQLSFNNTIYSLIATEEKGYIGVSSYLQNDEIQDVVRTFDGVSATDGTTRAVLPKRNMFFRIPYHNLPTTVQNTFTNESISLPTSIGGLVATAVTDAHRFEYSQTIAQLIDSYIPELLQNNDEVYTLYPGENQFQKSVDNINPEYCALDCSGPSFNETIWQLDQRLNTLINRDITGRSANNVLALPIIFNLRGNNDDTLPATIEAPTAVTQDVSTNWAKLNDICFNRNASNDYNTLLPKIFIKGVPIVDSDNSLVPHTFCCTITWTLTVDCTPRSNMNSNRLQWRITYPYLRANQAANGTITNQYIAMGNFAKKPYRFNTFKRTPMMRYNNLNTPDFTVANYTRANLKNKYKNSVGDISISDDSHPDDISPSKFGYTLPFHAFYEGHPLLRNTVITGTDAKTDNTDHQIFTNVSLFNEQTNLKSSYSECHRKLQDTRRKLNNITKQTDQTFPQPENVGN